LIDALGEETSVVVNPYGVTREKLVHALYEAAELEHNLMCTYLYAAASLKQGSEEGLSTDEASALERWRREILAIAIDEMGHLAAVWNITSALGAAPRFGRANFPLDSGVLPAGIVVRLAPFSDSVLQHFIFLERPADSTEPDGEGFETEFAFSRRSPEGRITPMAVEYATTGEFYGAMEAGLRALVEEVGEAAAFCGDPSLQLSQREVSLSGAEPVLCSKTALLRFAAIVTQGEGAPADNRDSHFRRFCAIREELQALKRANPAFSPAHPAAVNPVLRPPVRPSGRIWLEDPSSAAVADVANASYGLMLRLLAYSYQVPGGAEKGLVVDLSQALMRGLMLLCEQAARMPAGPTHPHCNAGVSFVALRDAAPLPPGLAARRFFEERLGEVAAAARATHERVRAMRTERALRIFADALARAQREFGLLADAARPVAAKSDPLPLASANPTPEPTRIGDVEEIEGRDLTLVYEGKRCIHARFCVTGAPKVFLANVKGPWIRPDDMQTESLVAIANLCPSGAIRYRRKDGRPDESAPPVNLITIREAGPYAVHAPIVRDGAPDGFRATLCRCGASRNKPFCDGSHHAIEFAATGEPPTREDAPLAQRDGALRIDPEPDGPLQIRGNVEIISGTGRVVARVVQAKLCRCGASATKPFCDGTHARIGFRSSNENAVPQNSVVTR
jgi:CDGSH-type Zn-finger protein/uncharacterized Fe-S cluster protein YjdI